MAGRKLTKAEEFDLMLEVVERLRCLGKIPERINRKLHAHLTNVSDTAHYLVEKAAVEKLRKAYERREVLGKV